MKNNFWLKIKASLTLIVLVLAFFVTNVQPAGAIPVEEILSIPEIQRTVLQKIQLYADKVWKTFGARLVGTTIRNTLNRVALDAAKYVASAGEGQKPTYIVEDLGSYWKNVGDAAAGDFIDGLGDGWGVDLCTPPSADIQAKISLGLVQTLAPDAPDCTITNLVGNYTSAYEKYAAMESGDYLKGIQVSFDAGGSELGGAFSLFGRTLATSTKAAETEKDKNTITQGWLDVRNIAGKLKGAPGDSKDNLANAKKAQIDSFSTLVGDPLVDAANTFLNQLAYEGFQRVMREISKGKSTSAALDTTKLASSGFESLIQYGESVVSEKLASVIKPRFDVRSDYSILSDLATCSDKENPGPNNCVIDDKFSQAISEKLTVGEALTKGYLHGDWLISNDDKSESTYTLRSASILRKYRIVPVGWEQAIINATSKGYKVTLQDLVSCFDGQGIFSANFDKNNQSWCRDLVDPNWVLKAPLNSCAKQGAGSQILSSLISQDANGLSVLAVSRANEYCADDQTCIKEKEDGSCEVYGYCNEEKRTWKFNSESCEPVYNTCQTFTSVSEKQTASFLENTLDYGTCDSNNSGCKQYSYNGVYGASTDTISWNKNASIFFNSKVTSCNASSEACTKLLRGKPGWADVNYIMDANFSLNNIGDTSAATNWHWPLRNAVATIVNDDGKALLVSGQDKATLYSDNDNNLLPKNLAPISGWSYNLSAEVKLISGDKVEMTFGGNKTEAASSTWTAISLTASDINSLDFTISAYAEDANASFSVRNLKLSPNNYYAGYSNYASFPVFEKLLPNYLESACYNSVSGTGNYTLKDNAPAVCSNFARKCNRDEVGCDLFTSVKDIFAVAAKANVDDYCDASCVGYDTYLAKSSYFYGTSADNLIPEKTTTCDAQSVGCASFTNLDAAGQGGESFEYYTKVRQCIKPDTTSCGDFYSWDNAQLKVMSLKKDANGDPFAVNQTSDSSCTKETYNLPIDNPRYNPDCREFYNKSGKITYHIISNTVSCSDDCRTYRLNEKNIDKTALNQAACTGTWDATQSVCYVCQNGGLWDTNQKACLYKVIPSEGTTCSAENIGCREYNGNNGSNLKLVASYDFEPSLDGFYTLTSYMITQSTESTVKNGHSLSMGEIAAVDVSSFAKKDSSYVIKFMAKASSNTDTSISFVNSTGDSSLFNSNQKNGTTIKGGDTWQVYEINLEKLNHEVKNEVLKIEVSGDVLIDNLVIHEITDKYYLIQGSSDVPDVCFYDMSDVYRGPSYNLGCSQYKDRASTTHNLHQFSELCQNSAVGCEQMIQTHDSSNYYGYTVNLNSDDQKVACTSGTPGCLEIKNAEAIYAVFDATKQCNGADAGCSRFGYLKTTNGLSTWVDSYKKNLPDTYNNLATSPLCQASEVGCDTWVYGNGSASYFKTPGLNTCVFKNNNWYKSPVKRCDTNTDTNSDGKITDNEKVGTVCLTDSDCGTKKCITDTNDYVCNTTYLKTIGLGGVNGRVATPDSSVGLCNVESSGCGEYIDPVSKYVNNLIYNPTAQTIDNSSYDKWTKVSETSYSQTISVKPNKLYILQIESATGESVTAGNFSAIKDGSGGVVRILGTDNKLGEPVSSITSKSSVMFNTGANTFVTVYRSNFTTPTLQAAAISVKEAVINYQLNTNIDTSSCNGNVNTDAGCILFNARTQVGSSGLKKNIFNATNTTDSGSPTACDPSNVNCINNTNTVIKVSPDRTCSRWLDCQTYTEDPITHERTCYKMGECDQLNEKNECGSFLDVTGVSRDIKNSQNKNATGYALLNNWYIGGMKEVGQNTDAHFDFESNSVSLTCARGVDVPASSALNAYKDSACAFDKNIGENLILSPANSPTDYPALGKGYLKVINYYQLSPGTLISVYSNRDYYVNYLVNTKNSSAKAKLVITDDKDNVITSFVSDSSNGWSRKVGKFSIPEAGGKTSAKKIKIYLTSTATNLTPGYVYFDDINIEPVLQTGSNSYVAKDCRLYPSDDSLSCLSANNNVIKDGLYGYCLQYDQLNPGVCLMWYPVDKISPITRVGQSVSGYSGKMPLYYCVEANGDFELVEYRKPYLLERKVVDRGNDYPCGNNFDGYTTKCGSQNLVCDAGYRAYVNRYDYRTKDAGDDRNVTFIFCVPDGAPLVRFKNNESDDKITGTYSAGSKDFDFSGTSGWFKYLTSASRFNVDSNPVRVLDTFNMPAIEDELKMLSDQTDLSYRMFCNKFIKVVEDDGNNIAWTDRIGRSSLFPLLTPTFFSNSSSLNLFGRNREDVPFGAAIIPSGHNWEGSDPVMLKNQYFKKQSESIFSGRPYGCSGGSGCDNMGYCDLDPNIYCIYNSINEELNKKSCSAAGAGSCKALWSSTPNIYSATNNINQLFARQYGFISYAKNPTGYSQVLNNIYSFTDVTSFIDQCGDPRRECVIYPEIKNQKIIRVSDGFKIEPSNGGIAIDQAGLYQLSFNTIINKEQQPMKQIVIDWGDGSTQIVTSLDNRPEIDTPHNFYHFYLKDPKRHVEVKIIDNWNTYKCSSMIGAGWVNDTCTVITGGV